jgi:hypothetical protein
VACKMGETYQNVITGSSVVLVQSSNSDRSTTAIQSVKYEVGFLMSNFRRVLSDVSFLLGCSPASVL